MNMTQSLNAHFDGKVIVPDEPVQLPVGQPLRVQVELGKPASGEMADAELLRRMEADGSLERIANAPRPVAGFRPIVIQGEPLSETIIKGRR
jgi:hypothetical protein